MKVVENTPDRLVIRRAPWNWAGWLIVCCLLLCGAIWDEASSGNWINAALLAVFGQGLLGLAFVLSVRFDELTMDRRLEAVQLRHRTVFRSETHTFPLGRFEQASTQSSQNSNGAITRRVALILTDHPKKEIRNITPGYGAGSNAEDTAKLINEWYKSKC